MSKLNNIELFAGAGGLLDGFEKTGYYNLVAAVEWLKPQVRTLINRLETRYGIMEAKDRVLNFDIQRTTELLNGWNYDPDFGNGKGLVFLSENKNIDVISGGPPCQAYSLAGRIRDANGMKDDYRNFLFEAYIEIVKYFKPRVIVFENVEGILSAIPTGERIVDLIRKSFDDAGYEIIEDLRKHALLDLSEFGVPQRRKRVIIVGLRRDVPEVDYQEILRLFYSDSINSIREKVRKNVEDAIKDLPPIYPLKSPTGRKAYANVNDVNGHISRYHNLRDQEIFYRLALDVQSKEMEYSSPEKLIQLYYEQTGNKTNVHKYHVLRWDEPSNTIPAHLKKDGLRHIHPDPLQKRTITVREAARLQTFDDDFEFSESQAANYEMIGNAIPPLFAEKLGSLIPKLINKVLDLEYKRQKKSV